MSEIDTGLKSTISYTPLVTEISEFILAGNGVGALNFAMSQLVDIGVEWELDVNNNRVKNVTPATVRYLANDGNSRTYGETPEIACQGYFDYMLSNVGAGHTQQVIEGFCLYGEFWRASVDIDTDSIASDAVVGYISVDTVSTQVLADAVALNAASQDALVQITLDKFANNDFAVELDANAVPF